MNMSKNSCSQPKWQPLAHSLEFEFVKRTYNLYGICAVQRYAITMQIYPIGKATNTHRHSIRFKWSSISPWQKNTHTTHSQSMKQFPNCLTFNRELKTTWNRVCRCTSIPIKIDGWIETVWRISPMREWTNKNQIQTLPRQKLYNQMTMIFSFLLRTTKKHDNATININYFLLELIKI